MTNYKRPVNAFPKGIYQGFGFKKGNKLGFKKGHTNCKGEKNPRFKGRIFRAGYWHIWKPEHPFSNKAGRIQEHRLVMEKKLGRYLEKSEVIHHINGDKSDNRIENLMLFKNSGEHTKFHFQGKIFYKQHNQEQTDKELNQENTEKDT